MPIKRVRASGGFGRAANHTDDLVNISQCDQQPFNNVCPLACLPKLILGAPADYIDPVLDKEPQEVFDWQVFGRPSTKASMITLNVSWSGEYSKS